MPGDGLSSNAAVRLIFRDRIRALGLSFSTVDHISGLTPGYVAKVLAEPPAREMGTMAMWSIAGAIGIAFVPVVDPEQEARVQARWIQRKRPADPAPGCVAPCQTLGHDPV